MNIFIGCVSYDKIDSRYFIDCNEFLQRILNGNNLVYGASSTGLMGLSYDVAKRNNSKVIGICPEAYKSDLESLSCDEELITNTVEERTEKVFEKSDALVFLPGGVGTLYELLAAIECKRAKEFDKPIVVYNSLGYYDRLIGLFVAMNNERFIDEKTINNIYITDNADDTLSYIENYKKNKCKVKVK